MSKLRMMELDQYKITKTCNFAFGEIEKIKEIQFKILIHRRGEIFP